MWSRVGTGQNKRLVPYEVGGAGEQDQSLRDIARPSDDCRPVSDPCGVLRHVRQACVLGRSQGLCTGFGLGAVLVRDAAYKATPRWLRIALVAPRWGPAPRRSAAGGPGNRP